MTQKEQRLCDTWGHLGCLKTILIYKYKGQQLVEPQLAKQQTRKSPIPTKQKKNSFMPGPPLIITRLTGWN